MKKSWEEFEPADHRGWRRLRCTCGFVLHPTPSPVDEIYGSCPGCGNGQAIQTYDQEVVAVLNRMENNPLPLGDWTAAGLEAVGLTKERWNAWKGEVGPCQSCVDRQERWNKLGRKIVGFLKG